MAVSFNQLALYTLILVLGWLFGLLSRSGGGAWRRKYEAECQSRVVLESEYQERERVADARIAELQRHSLAADATTAGMATTATAGVTASTIHDDLTLIRSIGRPEATALNEAGLYRFAEVSHLSDTAAAALENRIGLTPGTIVRDEWREQATRLADDDSEVRHGV